VERRTVSGERIDPFVIRPNKDFLLPFSLPLTFTNKAYYTFLRRQFFQVVSLVISRSKMELTSLPPATAQVAVELQLADIQAIMQGLNQGDEYAAFDAMRAELQKDLLLLQDQVFTLGLLRADYDTRVVFETLSQEERQAEQDHNLACELGEIVPDRSEQSIAAPRDYREGREQCPDDHIQDAYLVLASAMKENDTIMTLESFELSSSLYSSGRSDKIAENSRANVAGPSTTCTSKGKGKADVNSYEDEHLARTFCTACMEQYARSDTLELDCKRPEDIFKHAYCRNCLIDLLRTSLTDTTLFPPRCCGTCIPIFACVELCPPTLISQYKEKQNELAFPNPVYCSNQYCRKFIKPECVTADVAACPGCKEETCTTCKNPKHKGLCPEDPTVQMLMEVAGEKGWRRCPRCRTMIELLSGCYHMRYVLWHSAIYCVANQNGRCRCGGEFCYTCAKPWKTCACVQWDENRLISGNQIVDAPGIQIAMPEEEIQEADPLLDVVSDLNMRLGTITGGFAIPDDSEEESGEVKQLVSGCIHHWKQTHGKAGDYEGCGVCHHRLRFVNVCTTCKTKICNRCLNNRL
jgi:E3 ubiquitin-protein ligase RNF144